jgi:hypothetical protein
VPHPLAMCIHKAAGEASVDAIARQVPSLSPPPLLACAHAGTRDTHHASTPSAPLQMHLNINILRGKASSWTASKIHHLRLGDPALGWLVYNINEMQRAGNTSHITDGGRQMKWLAYVPGCTVGLVDDATSTAPPARQILLTGAHGGSESGASERAGSCQLLELKSARITGTRAHKSWMPERQGLKMASRRQLASDARDFLSLLSVCQILSLMRLSMSAGRKNPCLCRPAAGHGGRLEAKACAYALPTAPSGL